MSYQIVKYVGDGHSNLVCGGEYRVGWCEHGLVGIVSVCGIFDLDAFDPRPFSTSKEGEFLHRVENIESKLNKIENILEIMNE